MMATNICLFLHFFIIVLGVWPMSVGSSLFLFPFLPKIINQMDLRHINSSDNLVEIGINLKDYYPSVEWDIISVPAERHEKFYECCPNEFYPGESFSLDFFIVSIIIPLDLTPIGTEIFKQKIKRCIKNDKTRVERTDGIVRNALVQIKRKTNPSRSHECLLCVLFSCPFVFFFCSLSKR